MSERAMVESRVNSWKMSEWLRLAAMDRITDVDMRHQEKARDACDLIVVGYLNEKHGLSLSFESAPDTTDRRTPAPDCAYRDKRSGFCLAIEVKTPYDPCRRLCESDWRRFLKGVKGIDQYSYVILHEAQLPPKDRTSRLAAKAAATRALEGGRASAVALDEIFGFGVRVGRFNQADTPEGSLEVVVGRSRDLPAEDYVQFVESANRKLQRWSQRGYETMLLFDTRPLGAFSGWCFGEFGSQHDLAQMYHEKGFGDPRVPELCCLQYSDFNSLDHVLTLDLSDSGVGFESIWRRPNSRIQTPGGWLFKPDGWYDD